MSASQPLVLIGAGGHGREVHEAVDAMRAAGDERYVMVGFVANAADAALLAARGADLLGVSDDAVAVVRDHDAAYHLAMGSIEARARIDGALRDADLGGRAATVVHPTAIVGRHAALGPGAYVGAGAVVTTDVRVGRHAQINVHAVLSHDVLAGDLLTASPGALVNGNAVLGDRVFLGTGAIVLPGRSVGDDAVIAAGAVVDRDVPGGVTAIGVPARW